jgi:hypothetical protein
MWQVVGEETENSEQQIVRVLMDKIRPAFAAQGEAEEQERLRAQYPALQSAWDHYQMVLTLIRSNNPEIDSET